MSRPSVVRILPILVAVAGAARAQQANVDAQLFRPPALSGGVLSVDADTVAPHLGLSASLFVGYAHDPLVVKSADGKTIGAVVSDHLDFDATLAVSLYNRAEVGVLVPILVYQSVNEGNYPTPSGLGRSAIGDVRLEAKVRIHELALAGGKLGFAGAASLTLPTGQGNAFYGESDVTFRPRLIAGYRLARLELYLNVGAVFRNDRTIHDLKIGQQLSWGLAARVGVWRGLAIEGMVDGLVGLTGTVAWAQDPMEFLVGPSFRFEKMPLSILVAGGRGFTDGYGAPDARVVAAVRWQPTEPGDRDGDRITDDKDKCPDVPGIAELQGCPDVDTDGDKIVDRLDKCPREPGIPELEGCPDRDKDSDGIVDRLDKCPDVPGIKELDGCPDTDKDGDTVVDRLDKCVDVAGPVENQGCPWPDKDGDQILDKDDKCPDVPGIPENQGCPDNDSDGDGIVDRLDKCPFEREVYNGFEDDDGCPDKGPELAVLTDKGIEIKQQVQFDTGKATIRKKSFLLLATVAKILTLHPEITLMRVEGHTDTVGKRDKNMKLSQARAESVMKHLVEVNGIDKARLVAQGFGPDKPIADNKKAKGRQANRRVEFNTVEKKEPASGQLQPGPMPASSVPPPSPTPPSGGN